ncbi:MAG TPA: aminoglycoside adenylyltransferase domain-containing protein [Candidatus Limnocylindrales bacterium]
MESNRPPARAIDALTSEIRGALGDDLTGLYVYGSAVIGGFDPGVSDIDLIAVTSPEVEALDLTGLEAMHGRFLARNPEWRDRIEIVYIGRTTLGSFRTSRGLLAVISPGEAFHVRADRAGEWVQNWYLARETGVVLSGAPVDAVVPPIAFSEFVAATKRYAAEVRGRSRVGAGGGTLAYTILTMCRALRLVRMQAVGSKQEAAAWAREEMPEWAWLIDAALACRLSGGVSGLDDERSRTATETFVALLADQIL